MKFVNGGKNKVLSEYMSSPLLSLERKQMEERGYKILAIFNPRFDNAIQERDFQRIYDATGFGFDEKSNIVIRDRLLNENVVYLYVKSDVYDDVISELRKPFGDETTIRRLGQILGKK